MRRLIILLLAALMLLTGCDYIVIEGANEPATIGSPILEKEKDAFDPF